MASHSKPPPPNSDAPPPNSTLRLPTQSSHLVRLSPLPPNSEFRLPIQSPGLQIFMAPLFSSKGPAPNSDLPHPSSSPSPPNSHINPDGSPPNSDVLPPSSGPRVCPLTRPRLPIRTPASQFGWLPAGLPDHDPKSWCLGTCQLGPPAQPTRAARATPSRAGPTASHADPRPAAKTITPAAGLGFRTGVRDWAPDWGP